MEILSKFGERLTELMQNKNITALKLAEIIGVKNSTISRYKDGKMSIKLSKAIAIADYFKCSLEFLFGKSEKIIDFTLREALPFYPRLMSIMKANEITCYRLIIDLKKSNGHFDYWEKGGDPFMTSVIDLATYLDCTLDYLVGRER